MSLAINWGVIGPDLFFFISLGTIAAVVLTFLYLRGRR